MRRRAFLASGAAVAASSLAGCSGILGGGQQRTNGGFFGLQTAGGNQRRGEYLVDSVAADGSIRESFEGNLDAIEEKTLADTQSYSASSRDARDGEHALYYDYGGSDSTLDGATEGELLLPMPVTGAPELSFWANELTRPEGGIRIGWGFQDNFLGFALTFNLEGGPTGGVHVQTNGQSGTTDKGLLVLGEGWYKYGFTDVDWSGERATAYIEDTAGETLVEQDVTFTKLDS